MDYNYERLQQELSLLIDDYCTKNRINFSTLAKKASISPLRVQRAFHGYQIGLESISKILDAMGYEIEIVKKEN